MKENLKYQFEFCYEALQNINILEFKPDDLKNRIFESVLIGIFAKCIEFNVLILNKSESGSYFLLSSLRSITEELIAMKFIDSKFQGDKNELTLTYANKNCFDSILSQQEFFKQIGSKQPIMNSLIAPNELKNAEDKLKSIWSNEGLNRQREFPSVAQMATDGRLIKLYNYLYSATSSHVHFNPHMILRTGWNESTAESKYRHKFSTRNFEDYYEKFIIYYGSFLFLEMVQAFKTTLALDKAFLDCYKSIKKIIEDENTIPELVTFEEFNIRKGIYFHLSGMGLEHLE